MDQFEADVVAGRLNAMLIEHAVHLQPITTELVQELIDHSEYGLALLMLVDMIVEGQTPIGRSAHAEIVALARTMHIDDEIDPDLARLVRDDSS